MDYWRLYCTYSAVVQLLRVSETLRSTDRPFSRQRWVSNWEIKRMKGSCTRTLNNLLFTTIQGQRDKFNRFIIVFCIVSSPFSFIFILLSLIFVCVFCPIFSVLYLPHSSIFLPFLPTSVPFFNLCFFHPIFLSTFFLFVSVSLFYFICLFHYVVLRFVSLFPT